MKNSNICVERDARFKILTAVLLKVLVFWELCTQNYRKIPQNTVNCYPKTGGTNNSRVQRARFRKTLGKNYPCSDKCLPKSTGNHLSKNTRKNLPKLTGNYLPKSTGNTCREKRKEKKVNEMNWQLLTQNNREAFGEKKNKGKVTQNAPKSAYPKAHRTTCPTAQRKVPVSSCTLQVCDVISASLFSKKKKYRDCVFKS
jgi:hypothetical protein